MRSKRRRSCPPASISLPSPWRRHGSGAVLVVVLLIALVCRRTTQAPVQSDDRTRYHDRSFRVARVVDGDTLDIDLPDGDKPVTRIRLWGVDTPEVGRGGRASMHFGPEASAYARRILSGREVHVALSPKRTRGKYGRLLAYVHLERGGRMFNEMLLEGGYAYADLRFEHHYYRQFQAIEKRARKAGVGLWADITPDKMPPWKQRYERNRTNSGG